VLRVSMMYTGSKSCKRSGQCSWWFSEGSWVGSREHLNIVVRRQNDLNHTGNIEKWDKKLVWEHGVSEL
jgi:hypothetical protein